MTVTLFKGRLPCRITGRNLGREENKNAMKTSRSCSFLLTYRRRMSFKKAIKCCSSIRDEHISLIPSSIDQKRLDSNDATTELTHGILESTSKPVTRPARLQSVQTELMILSLPAIAGQAIEPLAQLMETAFIGRLGAYELASAAVSMSIFNIISKVFNIPLLSVATSFVAEDISKARKEFASDESTERKLLPSVSTALLLALAIGIFEASAMYVGSALFVNIMGLSSASPMYIAAQNFLSVRAIGAPAVVVYLASQGIFRGFKDTKTPVLCLGLGNLSAVFLFPLLMDYYGLGVTGAAVATVLSQYIVAALMVWHLNKKTVLSFPGFKNTQVAGYLKSGGFLLGRTLVSVMTITLSTSMAARLGPLNIAAHQICLQVWLSVSLLFDAQAASGQALIASSFAKGEYARVKEITYCVLKTGLFIGVSIAVILGSSFGSLATLFSRDREVLRIIRSLMLFISCSLPVTALAYTFDGLHYGISDFSFAAFSMMVVGAVSSAFLLYAPSVIGLSGVWTGLALFMGLRTAAGFLRISSKNGPWFFLQVDMQKLKVNGCMSSCRIHEGEGPPALCKHQTGSCWLANATTVAASEAVVVYHLDPFDAAPMPLHELNERPKPAALRNDRMLEGAELLGVGKFEGPEDILYDSRSGIIYTGSGNGWIHRVWLNESAGDTVVENWVRTCGRPLGLALGLNNEVIVADAYKGLLNISRDGGMELLADEAEGLKLKITDGVVVAEDGIIYLTDASHKYSLHEFANDILEGRPYGRLLSFDPVTKRTKVLLSGLYFPNGIALSPHQDFLVSCETSIYDGEGLYWIALATENTVLWDLAFKYPVVRKAMAIIRRLIRQVKMEKNGGVLGVDMEGKPVAHYKDVKLSMVSTGIKIQNYLYCGSLVHPYIIRLDLDPQARSFSSF
ncbi:hypothetical protein PTKIN_Ptkin07bG0311200 [Pterospermum kingtungense]